MQTKWINATSYSKDLAYQVLAMQQKREEDQQNLVKENQITLSAERYALKSI